MKYHLRGLFPVLLLVLLISCGQRAEEAEPTDVIIGLGPNLAITPNGVAVVSYIAPTDSGHALNYQVIRNSVWSDTYTVASGDHWFVNWADFPSVTPISDTLWAAHWLVRREAGGYAYDIYASVSKDAGQSWSTPFRLHNDGTDTEHGFVTLFPYQDRIGAVWLDGRNTATATEPPGGMTLRAGQISAAGLVSNEQVVDSLTCDCCQTDVAITSEGPVAVYRDRTHDEIRDIYISHYVDGKWQNEHTVHADNWEIAGCPVNGPVVQASGNRVVVTWFTGANEKPTIKTAWSDDAGRTFTAPIVVAEKNVVGYVGSALLSDDDIVASWICKASSERNAICYQKVDADGTLGALHQLESDGLVARMSVPQIGNVGGDLLFVWTDTVDDQFRINKKSVEVPTN